MIRTWRNTTLIFCTIFLIGIFSGCTNSSESICRSSQGSQSPITPITPDSLIASLPEGMSGGKIIKIPDEQFPTDREEYKGHLETYEIPFFLGDYMKKSIGVENEGGYAHIRFDKFDSEDFAKEDFHDWYFTNIYPDALVSYSSVQKGFLIGDEKLGHEIYIDADGENLKASFSICYVFDKYQIHFSISDIPHENLDKKTLKNYNEMAFGILRELPGWKCEFEEVIQKYTKKELYEKSAEIEKEALYKIAHKDDPTTIISGIEWYRTYEGGSDMAKREGKPILIFFRADWCQYSDKYIEEVFVDPEISKLMKENFVLIEVDIGVNKEDAEAFGIWVPPAVKSLNSDGEEIDNLNGWVPKEDFKPWLESVLSGLESSA